MAGITSRHPFNLYYNAGEYIKICGAQDGYFPDFGHHVPNEMGESGCTRSSCWTDFG